MKKQWQQLEGLLRSKDWHLSEETIQRLQPSQLLILSIALAAIYGFFMGWYAVFSRPEPAYMQVVACLWKVPLLFLATLFICFPSLYVFSTLLGSRLSFTSVLRLLLAITTISVTVLASFGPIVAFFALSTENYHFMKILNVAFFAVAGFFGIGALLKALRSLLKQEPPPTPQPSAQPQPPLVPPVMNPTAPFPLKQSWEDDYESRRVNVVFRIWIVIYMVVGAQMGWVLRPFLCDPNSPFAWFRRRHANFFIDVWNAILKMFS